MEQGNQAYGRVRVEKTEAGVVKLYYGQVVGIVLGDGIHMLVPNGYNASYYRLNGQRYACVCPLCWRARDDINMLLLYAGFEETLPKEVKKIVVYTDTGQDRKSQLHDDMLISAVERHPKKVAEGWEIDWKR